MSVTATNSKVGNPTNGHDRQAATTNGKFPPRLERVTFQTSREMDFFSERELVTQTGHPRDEWPLVIIKEVIDNALDACEEAGVSPIIGVTVGPCGITISDNGPGLPEATLRKALDFTIRVSNREAYVSPCRGAQGNAIKTLLPMPHVLDPEQGKFIVTAHGKRHEITCAVDPISQRPVIHDDEVSTAKKSKNLHDSNGEKKQAFSGTVIRLEWGRQSTQGCEVWPFGRRVLQPSEKYGDDLADVAKKIHGDYASELTAIVEGFAVFNPHATIALDCFGKETVWKATDPNWTKWKPCQPTSPHWYEPRHLERLIGAYITHERGIGADRLVSEFVAEFDGLSGSAKRTKVLTAAGLKRARLSEFVVDGRLDSDRIALLLDAMRDNTKPVNPKRLGLIGEEHLKERLLAMGVQPESYRYALQMPKSKKSQSEADEKASFLPWVLESAFGWLGKDAEDERKIVTGANWSAAIKNPFRSFGATGEGLETALADMRATRREPVVYVLHLAHPRVEYTDRGKSAMVIGGDA
jgi:DNA topoisomerase VI subunit B